MRQHYYFKTTCVALECRSLASDSEYEILIQFDSKLICDDWLKVNLILYFMWLLKHFF